MRTPECSPPLHKALSQILSPPLRAILWKAIGLALVLIVALAIGLQRLLSWFATSGEAWAETMLGPGFHTPLNILAWIRVDRGGAWRRGRRDLPDAGDHVVDRQRIRR